jgi:hypothetical protein
MTTLFNQTELNKRNKILKTHTLFGNFLNSDIINKLVHLFESGDIIKYVENERKKQKLTDAGISIKSIVFRTTNNDQILLLEIKKNNKVLLHLSIHLVVTQLKPEYAGVIHMYKNIHKSTLKINKTKKPLLYALIQVEQPTNKPKSLKFSIGNGYTTNQSIKNAATYDPELQKEMDAIITVLNNLFDEKKPEFYIGDPNKLYSIHNKTNNILKNINNHSTLTTRKNKGVRMLPNFSNNAPLAMSRNQRATTRRLGRRPPRIIKWR